MQRLTLVVLSSLCCAPSTPGPASFTPISLRSLGETEPGTATTYEPSISVIARGNDVRLTIVTENFCDWPVRAGFRIHADTLEITVGSERAEEGLEVPTIAMAKVCTTPGYRIFRKYDGIIHNVPAGTYIGLVWLRGKATEHGRLTTAAS